MTQNTQKMNGKLQLNSWFEIDESQYMWYILQGYTINTDELCVVWEVDGKYHRLDGPAVIYQTNIQYWEHGKFIESKSHFTSNI